MEKILFSSCLLGKNAFYEHPIIDKWNLEKRIISICPEVSDNLSIPRPSCEIIGGNGYDVLSKKAMVFSNTGIEKTQAFIRGAENTLNLAKTYKIKIAILKSNSPSCGNSKIYDGTFSNTVIDGIGVTAALLVQYQIKVFNEFEIEKAQIYLNQIEKC